MKRYLKQILIILVLSLGLLSGCLQEGKTNTQTEQDTRQKEFEQRLEEYYQRKLTQLEQQREQVNIELASLRAEIHEIESDLARPLPMKSLSKMTKEEIAQTLRRPGLESRWAQLKEQEETLLATKQSLEQDIEELERLLGKE